jgi:Subtilase family
MAFPLFPTLALLVGLFAGSSAAAQSGSSNLAPLGQKPSQTIVNEHHQGQQLILKFAHDSGVRLRDGILVSTHELPALVQINQQFANLGASISRLIQRPEAELDAWRAEGEARSGQALHDLNLFFLVELPDADQLGSTCDACNSFDLIELAYPVGTLTDPIAPSGTELPELSSTLSMTSGLPRLPSAVIGLLNRAMWQPNAPQLPAPDYESNQGYRRAAPLGIDADYGQNFSGSRGEGTTIADVETGWTHDHEDIRHKSLNQFIGLAGAPYPWDHGTAVLGELVGEDNASGVKGSVHQADVLMSSHLGSVANIPTAIAYAAAAAGPGDVVVLEVQCYSSAPSPHPCEYDAAIFATVQTATAAGTHVFAAAGNGSNNLDSAAYGGLFDRNVRDSGAVMCGASDGSSLNAASFSNYGTRLDAHGWGFQVTTTGYGDLYTGGSVLTEYTAAFSGTSSATPIVTGAGVMVNGIAREAFGVDLDPLVLRSVLATTGTPQGTGGRIGPRPDVRAAIAQLGVPTVSVGGSLIPGGSVDITIAGTPGDSFQLGYSRQLLAAPAHLPPLGYRYLGALRTTASGTIGANGSTTLSYPIPSNGGLSGKTVGYVQAAVFFQSGPGNGSFTNYMPIEVQ